MTDRPQDVFDELGSGAGRNFADTLRAENTGAVLLLLGAVAALVWWVERSERAASRLLLTVNRRHCEPGHLGRMGEA